MRLDRAILAAGVTGIVLAWAGMAEARNIRGTHRVEKVLGGDTVLLNFHGLSIRMRLANPIGPTSDDAFECPSWGVEDAGLHQATLVSST